MRSFLRSIRRFLSELRRRNVYRVALAYLAAGFVVVELASIATGAFDLPGWFQPMVWTVCGLGFPIALVMAWALEVTPEGVRVEEPEGSVETPSPDSVSLTSTGLIVGLLAVAIGLQLYPRVFSSGDRASSGAPSTAADTAQIDERSIAVLPFEPLSKGEESETFARGVHDDLLTRLSNISDLTVTSRTSVEKYRDTGLALPAIADSLGVRWVMVGGVQQAGDQIQVNAQLIDPRSDAHVWAEDYRRDLTAENLFAIQGEITREIADAMQAKLTAGEQRRVAGAPTQNLRAYRLYVQGRELMTAGRPDSIRRARRYFERALQTDSSYARAWAGLADARIAYAFVSSVAEARDDSIHATLPAAEAAARRALKLNPDLAEAHASRGHLLMYEQWLHLEGYSQNVRSGRGPQALRHLRRAVELRPSYVQAQHWLGECYLSLGRPEAALRHLRLATELRPDHFGARFRLAFSLIATERHEAALTEARRLQSRYPELEEGQIMEAEALLHLRRWQEVRPIARTLRADANDPYGTPTDSYGFGIVLPALADVATGDTASARRRIQTLRERGVRWQTAVVLGALGEVDAAFETLSTVEEWSDANPVSSSRRLRYFYPDLLSAFRADPRYRKLIEALNKAWGLNPDGSLPEDADPSITEEADADA